jgi:hypothetical protein
MLEVRVKQLEEQARDEFRYSETLLARLVPFLMMEAIEKEAAKKEAAKMEAAKKEVAKSPMAHVIFIMSYFYF